MSSATIADDWPRFDGAVFRNPDMSDTRGWSSERRDAANASLAAFNESYPHLATCAACGHRKWHAGYTSDGSREWQCSGCGRRRLPSVEWDVERARLKKAEEQAEAAKPKLEVPTSKSARATLSNAISRRDAARAELAKLQSAAEVARETIASTEAAHAAAETALQQAQAGAGVHMVTALLDGHPQSNGSLRALRIDLEDRGDELAAAHAMRKQLGAQLDQAQSAIPTLERGVREAALSVLRIEVGPAAAESADRARHEFVRAMQTFVWLHSQAGLSRAMPTEARPGVRGPTLIDHFYNAPSTWREAPGGCHELETALAELQRNSNAPLPV